MIKKITSIQNPFIKNLLLLELKPKTRQEQNRFIIEGVREIGLAIAGGYTITDLCFTPGITHQQHADALIEAAGSDANAIELTKDVFNRVAYRKDNGGMIALAILRRPELKDLSLGINPLLLVLETVEKPGNLGAMLRTADAAGLDAVIICDPSTDMFNPNVVRSSIGCIFTLPVVTAPSTEVINWLHTNNISIMATALTATRCYYETDFSKPTAIIMGSEAQGLSDPWLKQADSLIKIPMRGKIDSMNVSVSAAIVVFEALRQRDNHKISVPLL
ncbi:MAG: RNA methyltransferase [Bacteroidales bacterium]|nr:RNA methyltransferase [Bacteroidales bacterium]HNW75113.1 RNA methyltransferase [Bacteroidales bacterium]HPS49201.1 RNA methyltransferase [Bacteroidales bacterium]